MSNEVDDRMREFLKRRRGSEWFKYKGFKVYLRNGYHLVDGEIQATFDFANFGTSRRNLVTAMAFYKWLLVYEMEGALAGKHLYIENVFNETLVGFFKSRRYEQLPGEGAPCFLKRVSK